jgi:sterol carrier protein 2
MTQKVYVVGVGMTKFEKPGRRKGVDYIDDALEAATKALLDANLTYDDVQFAAVGYCFGMAVNNLEWLFVKCVYSDTCDLLLYTYVGDSTSGQRALYQLGLTQIPVVNVNNK